MCQSFLLVAVRFMLLLTLHSFHTVFGHETSATSKASRQCTRVIFFDCMAPCRYNAMSCIVVL